MNLAEHVNQLMEERDKQVAAELDGHYCMDWDELAVSAWTPEYPCCTDFKKTRKGKLANCLFMFWFNLGWFWCELKNHPKELLSFYLWK